MFHFSIIPFVKSVYLFIIYFIYYEYISSHYISYTFPNEFNQ